MFLNNDRGVLRQQYFTAWQKYHAKQSLSSLESQLIQVIQDHPEYQDYLDQPERYTDHHFDADDINPFLHMSMHLALRDQIQADTPQGIQSIFDRALLTLGEPLQVEHEMMHVLTEHIWIMIKQQQTFNGAAYLESLQRKLL